jgi:hypothetical protein
MRDLLTVLGIMFAGIVTIGISFAVAGRIFAFIVNL